MSNLNNWRRELVNDCSCGCGEKVAKNFKKGHGRRRPIAERIAQKVAQQGDCLVWTGAKTNGYGVVGVDGYRTKQTHRVVYALAVGPIPEGLQLDHLCRQRDCINPAHLEPVTQAENIRRENAARWHGTAPTSLPSMTVRDLIELLKGTRP